MFLPSVDAKNILAMTSPNDEIWQIEECQIRMKKLFSFLRRWKWLVTTRPIQIVANGTFECHANIIDVLAALPLEMQNRVLLGHFEESWPNELKELIIDSTAVTLKIPDSIPLESCTSKGAMTKKSHETSRLSALVKRVCDEMSLKGIVDVGAGLGYVDRELCDVVEGCTVLAVESEEARCARADKLNRNKGLGNRILQLPKKLHSDNVLEVAETVTETMKDLCCLIALHACGDLTISALKLFEEAPSIRSTVIVSCCYHKMTSSTVEGRNVFNHFPCSEYVKSMITDESGFELCDVSFLRLAAESTREMWLARDSEQLSQHARSVLFRALIKNYEEKSGIVFRKRKRKAVKTTSRDSWKNYATAWASNTVATNLNGMDVDEETIKRELLNLSPKQNIDNQIRKSAAYNTLRNLVQNAVESFVLLDRLIFLKERGFNCFLSRVSDPALSPRSVAIVACK